MDRVVHFEIEADKPERAVNFYTRVFGWDIKKWDGPMEYLLVVTGPNEKPGINGGIYKREKPLHGESIIAYVCTIGVPSIDESLSKIEDNGGSIVMPKQHLPSVGWLARCKDTEGNVFGVIQAEPM